MENSIVKLALLDKGVPKYTATDKNNIQFIVSSGSDIDSTGDIELSNVNPDYYYLFTKGTSVRLYMANPDNTYESVLRGVIDTVELRPASGVITMSVVVDEDTPSMSDVYVGNHLVGSFGPNDGDAGEGLQSIFQEYSVSQQSYDYTVGSLDTTDSTDEDSVTLSIQVSDDEAINLNTYNHTISDLQYRRLNNGLVHDIYLVDLDIEYNKKIKYGQTVRLPLGNGIVFRGNISALFSVGNVTQLTFYTGSISSRRPWEEAILSGGFQNPSTTPLPSRSTPFGSVKEPESSFRTVVFLCRDSLDVKMNIQQWIGLNKTCADSIRTSGNRVFMSVNGVPSVTLFTSEVQPLEGMVIDELRVSVGLATQGEKDKIEQLVQAAKAGLVKSPH